VQVDLDGRLAIRANGNFDLGEIFVVTLLSLRFDFGLLNVNDNVVFTLSAPTNSDQFVTKFTFSEIEDTTTQTALVGT